MHYSFDIELAKKYGDREAILLQNFIYWIAKNAANGKNYHDGRYWTYNSVAALVALFPFWTYKQVRNILASLVSQGCLIEGNYNEMKYDRTKWYALGDEVANCICQTWKFDSPETENPFAQMGRPIPDNKPDINTNNKQDNNAHARAFDFKKALMDLGISEQTAADWMAVRKNAKATNTKTAFNALRTQIEKIVRRYGVTAEQVAAFAVGKDWKAINAEWDAVKQIKNAIAGANNGGYDPSLPF